MGVFFFLSFFPFRKGREEKKNKKIPSPTKRPMSLLLAHVPAAAVRHITASPERTSNLYKSHTKSPTGLADVDRHSWASVPSPPSSLSHSLALSKKKETIHQIQHPSWWTPHRVVDALLWRPVSSKTTTTTGKSMIFLLYKLSVITTATREMGGSIRFTISGLEKSRKEFLTKQSQSSVWARNLGGLPLFLLIVC